LADETVVLPEVNTKVAEVLPKPRLEAAIFCEYANQTPDGKTNLGGVFDRLYVNRETKQSGGFFLFVRLAEATQGLIRIALLDPNDKPVMHIGLDVSEHSFEDTYPKLVQYLDRVGFQATELGTYWLDVSYKGEFLGGASLIVEVRPEEKKDERESGNI
jgi:hypothetical protein